MPEWNDVVSTICKAADALQDKAWGTSWFLFGSALKAPDCAEDIDILIVYEHRDPRKANALCESAELIIDAYRPTHFVMLSDEEDDECRFSVEEGAVMIWGRTLDGRQRDATCDDDLQHKSEQVSRSCLVPKSSSSVLGKPSIQATLGRNLVAVLARSGPDPSEQEYGDAVLSSVRRWIAHYTKADGGRSATSAIYSDNLRKAAEAAARNARIVYLLGKVSLQRGASRRGLVRTQIFDYGSVCEALLLDLVQCVGKQDRPKDLRPKVDAGRGKSIDWAGDGLFKVRAKRRASDPDALDAIITFKWLIDQAIVIGAIDSTLANQLNELRESRNVIHAAIPTRRRYESDLDRGREAREVALRLNSACVAFKTLHSLPMPSP